MTDSVEHNDAEQVDAPDGKEAWVPHSKYERIMLAAVEASRLNEEIRRKGIKLDNKVTIEAIKRVDEGKVQGVLRESFETVVETPAPSPEMPASSLFEEPPLTASPTEGDDAATTETEASDDSGDKDKS